MKSKRILAMILSVVMVATSGNFTLSVHATEDADDKSVVIADVDSVSDAVIGDGNDYAGEEMQGDSNLYGTGDSNDEIIDQNTYFVVYGDGVLRVKEGVSLGKKVALPAKAKIIPKGIFNVNTSITTLEIPDDSQLTTIEAGAFERSGVEELKLPKGVTEIAEGTFKSSKLKTITFATGSGLTSIGKEAFAESKLTNIMFPGSVQEIGESAFKACTSLTTVNLVNVEVIGVEAFKSCTALKTSLTWGQGLREIKDGAFEGSGLEKIDLSGVSGITTWGTRVFAECKGLTQVTLNGNMKVIPAETFRDCEKLTTVSIPVKAHCETIEKEAFYGCTALATVTIPAQVNTIESNAFGMCKALTKITINQGSDSGESTITLAADAFPEKDGVTMYGYDGTVEAYAAKRGYKFESLVKGKEITVASGIKNGTVTVSPKEAKPGETVEVTVKPSTGYRLQASSFYYLGDDDFHQEKITKLVSDTSTDTPADGETTVTTTAQVFSFVMPDQDVTVYAEFVTSSTDYGTLSVEGFEPVGDLAIYWDAANKTANFDRVGTAARLIIQSSKPENVPGSWEFTYSSSKTSVAVIDSEGVIYARGAGETKITAKLKNSSKSVTFTVKVAAAIEDAENVKLALEFSGYSPADITTETFGEKTVTVIQYTKADLATRDREFKVSLKATSGDNGANLYLASTWKSYNTSLANPEETTVWNNANTIQVKSGVSGETTISVTATNGLTDKNKVEYGKEQTFIIRVIDTTPRLVQSSLTVNALSSAGTEFDLIPVYGYAVKPESLHIVEVVKSGTVKEYEDCTYFVVDSTDGSKCYLKLTDKGEAAVKEKGKDISYSNKLYIEGTFDTVGGGTFRIPIKSVVVTNKALKPTVKLSGKLNLFFNSKADVADRGEVIVTQSLKDLKVESYALVSEENYNKGIYDAADDPLANNFVVDADGVLTRSDNALENDTKNKPITKGYLKITYAGYKEPCYVKITVPVETKKPNYVLSSTKATVHTNSVGYVIPLQILDKKTKKAISLDSLKQISFDESAAGLTSDSFDATKNGDEIELTIKRAQKGKAIINVEMDTWNEPLKFTFNLSVTSKLPTVKAKSSTLTLNNVYVGRVTYTEFTVSQKDVKLIDMSEPVFKGKDSQAEDAANIDINFNDGVLTAVAYGEVKKGSYKFTMTPQLQYQNGLSENAKPITITVKVVETKLTMAMKSKTLTLNRRFTGVETAQTTYTIKNLPAGEEAVIKESGNFNIEGANKASIGSEGYFDFTFETDPQNEANQRIAVGLNQPIKAGTYKFKVTGLETGLTGSGVEIQPFTFSVKVVDKDPKFTVKASGSLNPCNAESYVTYKFTVSNLNARITDIGDVDVQELNSLNAMGELQHFEVEDYVRDADGYITGVVIGTKEGAELDAKTAYKLKIGVRVSETTGFDYSAALAVKFKQTLPKIKVDVTSATMYAGAAAGSSERAQEILITKTTETGAEIEKVVLAGSNSDAIKQAFDVDFDETTQIATIKLTNPAMLKANTQYNVKFEVKVKGQLANTTGPTFTVKVKVMN